MNYSRQCAVCDKEVISSNMRTFTHPECKPAIVEQKEGEGKFDNEKLISDFNYGTYQNELTRDIATNTVKIHLRKQIELLQSMVDCSRQEIIAKICELELQRSELL
jgi:transcriptional regulator NrdR family protein